MSLYDESTLCVGESSKKEPEEPMTTVTTEYLISLENNVVENREKLDELWTQLKGVVEAHQDVTRWSIAKLDVYLAKITNELERRRMEIRALEESNWGGMKNMFTGATGTLTPTHWGDSVPRVFLMATTNGTEDAWRNLENPDPGSIQKDQEKRGGILGADE